MNVKTLSVIAKLRWSLLSDWEVVVKSRHGQHLLLVGDHGRGNVGARVGHVAQRSG